MNIREQNHETGAVDVLFEFSSSNILKTELVVVLNRKIKIDGAVVDNLEQQYREGIFDEEKIKRKPIPQEL